MINKALAGLLVGFAALPCAWAAPDREGKLDAGIGVSGYISTDEDIGPTAYVSGGLSYGIGQSVAVGAEVGVAQSDTELKLNGESVDAGELLAVPILATVTYRPAHLHDKFVPYGTIGLGIIVWDFNESSLFEDAGIGVGVDTSFAAKFGGGFDWFLTDRWIANFEGAYYLTSTDVTGTSGGVEVTDTADLNFWTAGAGLKYVFGQ